VCCSVMRFEQTFDFLPSDSYAALDVSYGDRVAKSIWWFAPKRCEFKNMINEHVRAAVRAVVRRCPRRMDESNKKTEQHPKLTICGSKK